MNDRDLLDRLTRERDPMTIARFREAFPEKAHRFSDEHFYTALGTMLELGIRIALESFGYRERTDG